MCIIVSKPRGVVMPDEKILKNCWRNNSDGAGFSYVREGSNTVCIVKGFMKLKALIKSLEYHKFTPEDDVVLHFRFATHGLCDGGNCHPFPLSARTVDLRSKFIITNIAIAHNGIFGQMPDHETLSDTQKFISTVLANKAVINNLDSAAVQELIRGYCGSSSKLAIMRPSGILHIGDFVKDEGMYYSNSQYKEFGFTRYGNHDYTNGSWQGHYDNTAVSVIKAKAVDYVNSDEQNGNRLEALTDQKIRDIEGYNHNCLLCGTQKEVSYTEDADGYLCDPCYALNYGNALQDD